MRSGTGILLIAASICASCDCARRSSRIPSIRDSSGPYAMRATSSYRMERENAMNACRLLRNSVPIIACVVLLLAMSGCARGPEPALRIGTNVWIGCEPLYLARELGNLDPATVQLVEYPSASEVLRAYRNQAIDGMVISLDKLF